MMLAGTQMGEENGDDQPQKYARVVENPPGLGSDSRNPPANIITLDALMMAIQKGNDEGAHRHKELTGSISNVERQLEGVKTTAAKALCTAEETKHEMTTIRARVEALERGGGSSSASTVCSENGEKNAVLRADMPLTPRRTHGGDGTPRQRRPSNTTWEKRGLNCWGVNKDGNS